MNPILSSIIVLGIGIALLIPATALIYTPSISEHTLYLIYMTITLAIILFGAVIYISANSV